MKDFKDGVLPWFFPKKLQIWQYFEDEEEKTAAEEHLRATTTGQFRQSERGDAADLARGGSTPDRHGAARHKVRIGRLPARN